MGCSEMTASYRGLRGALTLALLAAACASTAAQQQKQRVLQRDATHVLFGSHGSSRRSSLEAQDATAATAAAAAASSATGATAGGISYETLRVVAHPTRDDTSQKRVQQTHLGLQLYGHSFVIGLGADGVTETAEGTYGKIFTGLDQVLPDVTPTLTTEEAVEAAQTIEGLSTATALNVQLVIWIEKEDGNEAHLAYVITLTGSGPGRSDRTPVTVLVDARSGEVLRAWKQQRTQHAPRPRPKDGSTTPATDSQQQLLAPTLPATAGTGHARRGLRSKSSLVDVWAIGGNEKVGRIYYNGSNGNPALQVTKNAKDVCFFISKYVKTGDILQVLTQEQWNAGLVSEVTSLGDTAWLSGNFTEVQSLYNSFPAVGYICPSPGEYLHTTDATKGSYSQHADVQAVMSVIFDMWKTWLGVDVIALFKAAKVPTPLLVIPHADPTMDNANWGTWYFECGDGDVDFYPLCTAGDVLAHELGHGVTQIINSALLYFGQAGAWNEAFSDMIGMTYTFYHTGRVDPLIGAGIMLGTAPCLRNMSNPAAYQQSSSAMNLTTPDPHALSGVPNLAFYKLATSPCYDPKVAMLVAQRAAHLYFTPTTSFEDGANAWVRAAKDLGYNQSSVRQAWVDVGLWQACGAREVEVMAFDIRSHGSRRFKGAANKTVSVANYTYEYLDASGLHPCGVSFNLLSLDSIPPTLAPANASVNVYVGINRLPDPIAGVFDCKLDMTNSATGPAQPTCDVPGVMNATYYLVAYNPNHDWDLQGFQAHVWGPTVGNDQAGQGDHTRKLLADAPSPKCFTGGACSSDSACSSGYCFLGYCATKR